MNGWGDALALAGIVLAGSSVQRMSGMGFALVAVPALVLLIGPADGVALSNCAAGVISAVDTAGGEAKWKLRVTGPFSASPVGAGSRLLVASEKGLVQIVQMEGGEGVAAGQLQLPLKAETKELILATPSLSKHQVFLRTDSTLWCLE